MNQKLMERKNPNTTSEVFRIGDKVLVTERVFGITHSMGSRRRQGKVVGITPTKIKVRFNIFNTEWVGSQCVERILY